MMGESSACLMRSFSQPSSSYHEATEGDHMRALTSSISFGRYMSESLAWEKWSSFTHNRYMEEVEKYSRPGSVAQMKAYFEAHYKKKAAERAAASLEQNAAPNSTSELKMRTEKENDSPMNQELAPKNNHIGIKETEQVEAPQHEEERELEDLQVEEAERPILAENQREISNQLENVEDGGKVMSNQGNKTHVKNGATLGDSASSDKKKSSLSSTKSTGYSGVPKPPAPPKPTISLPKRTSINASPNGATLGDSVSPDKTKSSLSSIKSTGYSGVPKPPAPQKSTISLPKRTSINASPNCKKTTTDSTNRKRETSRSLHMSINFASRETDKPLSPILQKIVNSRLVKTLAKAAKDRTTTQQAPTWASVDISKRPIVTQQRGNNRPRTPLNQSRCESGKVEGKSQSPCMGVCGRKAQSPIISCSFSFKSEERAAKRKEFFERLELKSKAKETEKEQLPAKLKEKARLDYKDMHQSATLKPKLNPKLSQGTESPSETIKKVPPMRPCSPKFVRKTHSQPQDINSRPPWRLTTKTDGCKETRGKSNWDPPYYTKSVPKKTVHENTSPNIQL